MFISPWLLTTPRGSANYQIYRDEAADPPALVCTAGTTTLRYDLRCINDLHAMLQAHGDWMLLGSADEQKLAAPGTVEAWARSPDNPIGGWYGLKKGLRGRFAMYWTGADLVVEVVSPDDPERDTHVKRSDYAEAGIPEYWIVNPIEEAITVLTLRDDQYTTYGSYGRGERAYSRLLAGFSIEVMLSFRCVMPSSLP